MKNAAKPTTMNQTGAACRTEGGSPCSIWPCTIDCSAAMAWACCSANITAITRPGRRKNTPATMARTSLLPCIRAMASFHAALMLNFMPIPPQRMRPTLDKLESNRQQIAPMENSNTRAAETIEWRRSADPVPYRAAHAEQQSRNEAIAAGEAGELVWLLEHPPVYTAGTSAVAHEVLEARFEV